MCGTAVQEGQIVEEGAHQQLYANDKSVYHSLVKLQEQAMDKRADVTEAVQQPSVTEALEADALPMPTAGGQHSPIGRKDASRVSESQRRSLDVQGQSAPGEKTGLGEDKKEEELVRCSTRFDVVYVICRPVTSSARYSPRPVLSHLSGCFCVA